MIEIRKIIITRETVLPELGVDDTSAALSTSDTS
jgi:hypothetical protein